MIEMVSPQAAQQSLRSPGVALVGFKAPWCPQCEPQRNVVERIAPRFEDRVTFAYVDLETHPEAQDMFGLSSLPALVIARDGKVCESLSGFTSAPKLNAALQALVA